LNEPDEDLESSVPEEPLPEPDALLEALVEAETEAPPRRRVSITLIAACVLASLGVWQIVHVSNGGEPIFQIVTKAKTAPTKLHSDGRVPIGRVLQSTDPIAAYLDRSKRGMTDQEILWMIEDFEAAGLDEEEHSLKGILRAKQQLWYLEALTEGLQLSPEQRAQAKAKMDALLAADVETFETGVSGLGTNSGLTRIDDAMPIAPMAESFVWLMKDAYAPWNLCELSKEQDQLTMHRWRESERKSALRNEADDSGSTQEPAWMQLVSTKQDPVSGNIIELGESNPHQFAFEGHGLYGRILVVDAFPLTPNQKDPVSPTGLDQARCLQAPQLRMAMLMESSAAASLLNQLDHPIIEQTPTGDPGIFTELPHELPPNTVEPETPVDPFSEPDSK